MKQTLKESFILSCHFYGDVLKSVNNIHFKKSLILISNDSKFCFIVPIKHFKKILPEKVDIKININELEHSSKEFGLIKTFEYSKLKKIKNGWSNKTLENIYFHESVSKKIHLIKFTKNIFYFYSNKKIFKSKIGFIF